MCNENTEHNARTLRNRKWLRRDRNAKRLGSERYETPCFRGFSSCRGVVITTRRPQCTKSLLRRDETTKSKISPAQAPRLSRLNPGSRRLRNGAKLNGGGGGGSGIYGRRRSLEPRPVRARANEETFTFVSQRTNCNGQRVETLETPRNNRVDVTQ